MEDTHDTKTWKTVHSSEENRARVLGACLGTGSLYIGGGTQGARGVPRFEGGLVPGGGGGGGGLERPSAPQRIIRPNLLRMMDRKSYPSICYD